MGDNSVLFLVLRCCSKICFLTSWNSLAASTLFPTGTFFNIFFDNTFSASNFNFLYYKTSQRASVCIPLPTGGGDLDYIKLFKFKTFISEIFISEEVSPRDGILGEGNSLFWVVISCLSDYTYKGASFNLLSCGDFKPCCFVKDKYLSLWRDWKLWMYWLGSRDERGSEFIGVYGIVFSLVLFFNIF